MARRCHLDVLQAVLWTGKAVVRGCPIRQHMAILSAAGCLEVIRLAEMIAHEHEVGGAAQALADGGPKEDALSHLGARLQAWISTVDAAVAKDPAAPLHTVMPEGGELGSAVAEVSSLLGDRQDLAMPILQRILQRMLEVSGFRYSRLPPKFCLHAHADHEQA